MRVLLATPLLIAALGCASTPRRDACVDLGRLFYLMAEVGERRTENEQLLWVNERFEDEASRKAALRIVSWIYETRGDPLDVGREVARSCRVEGSRVVLAWDGTAGSPAPIP